MAIKAEIHKMLARIANREDPDQTASFRLLLKKQSDQGLHCLSRPFKQATSVRNFKTFTIALLQNSFLEDV